LSSPLGPKEARGKVIFKVEGSKYVKIFKLTIILRPPGEERGKVIMKVNRRRV